MLVSDSHKFIFVHIFKTGGTSVKRALRRYAMPRWQEHANFFLKRMGIRQYGPPWYPDHMRATELIESVGREHFDSYFSFAFVRNPWDLEVSHYKYVLKTRVHPSHELVTNMKGFHEYIRWRCDGNFALQRDFVFEGHEQVVDFVGKFESLNEDFQAVCDQIGVHAKLPALNATRRRPYHEYYDSKTLQLVEKAFAPDLRAFGYQWDTTDRGAA